MPLGNETRSVLIRAVMDEEDEILAAELARLGGREARELLLPAGGCGKMFTRSR